MKLVVLAVLLATGCGSNKEQPAADPAPLVRPTVTDPIGFCERARIMMAGRVACFPEDTSIKMGLEEIADLVANAPSEPEPRRKVAASCATMLDGMMRAQQPKNCPLDVTETERAELEAFLVAWNRDRKAAAP
jgi:hypothetical protein